MTVGPNRNKVLTSEQLRSPEVCSSLRTVVSSSIAVAGMFSSAILIPLVAMRGYRLPEAWIVARLVLVLTATAGLVFVIPLLVSRAAAVRIRMLPLAMLVVWLYPLALPTLVGIGVPEAAIAVGAGIVIVVVLLLPSWLAKRARLWARTAEQFGIAAAGVALVLGATLYWQERGSGLPSAILSEMTVPVMLPVESTPPDIYHVIFDGLGRPDMLKARYGLDLDAEMDRLRSLGFSVEPDAGLTNYTQTYQVLASMLNMRYLNDLPATVTASPSREPMHELIQNASVIASLRAAGYRVDVLAGTAQLRWHSQADTCECEYPWIGLFESQIILRSPLHLLPWQQLQHSAHRAQALSSLESLEAYLPGAGPRLLLAHVMLPHPPFVVGSNGEPTNPERPFSFAEGPLWDGSSEEYRSGYAAQAAYTVDRLHTIAGRLGERARTNGRRAIVIMHGDHGPSRRFNGTQPFDADEVFPVFLAVRAPDRALPLEVARIGSLVNLYRVVFATYFATNLGPLPNRMYMSSFARPYAFEQVRNHGSMVPQTRVSDSILPSKWRSDD